MHRRSASRATALALTATLAIAGVAFADQIVADGDAVTAGSQPTIDLGVVAPGAVIAVPVTFELRCTGTNHGDPGQTVTLSLAGSNAPAGGSIVSVTNGSVGPIPADWPADGQACPDPSPRFGAGTSSTVTIQAPVAVNVGYIYTVGYARSYSPTGGTDALAVPTTPTFTIRLAVAADQAPVLVVPADFTVEGDTAGGWNAAYTVSATDTEDDPDPTPTCAPAAGSVLPLGLTTVTCDVTDTAGHHVSDSFDVTVADTTAPTLDAHGPETADTTDPNGVAVSYTAPGATDVVDPAPSVSCLPASGSTFVVGTATVTCTATDASSNTSTSTFDVTVTHTDVPPTDDASARWLPPLGLDAGGTATVQAGSNVPLKLVFTVNGTERRTGVASVAVKPCSGGDTHTVPLTAKGGTWSGSLKTSGLAGCQTLTAWIDGLDAGSITLQLKGPDALKHPAPGAAKLVAPALHRHARPNHRWHHLRTDRPAHHANGRGH